MSRTPTLAEVITHALDSRLSEMRLSLPAKVVKYDAEKQRIDAKPLIRESYYDEQDDRQIESLPIITSVPVVFPGAGGYRLTFPVTVGDTVLLVFSASSLDKWLTYGGEVDPVDDRKFSLSDAIAIPGLRDYAHALTDAPTDRATLGYDEGPQINLTADEIRLGANTGLEGVGLGETIETILNEIRTKFNAHSHASSGAAPPATPIGPIDTCASGVVKVKP